MKRFEKICSMCEVSASVSYNDHETIHSTISGEIDDKDRRDEIGKEVFDEMVRLNRCYSIQIFPRTSIGYLLIYHHDLDILLDKALEELEKNGIRE